ncbi:MAG: hypothetical protein HWN81_16810 [Candidatus Lokiarchaeota archaeon]|nr:hypothetical protein [Candidatus Lokiarchaeota archaeon]
MQLYLVTESGSLRKIIKVDFNENKVFLIDDIKTLYLWFGFKVTDKKKDLSLKRTEKLKNQRKKTPELIILNQNAEYGSFLAIMDILKKGLKAGGAFEKRPELKIRFNDTQELIEAGIDPDFESEITVAAHNLAQENHPYEDLCRKLAEIQMKFIKGKASEKEIKKKTEEIYKSSSTYEELCWLIAELSKLFEKNL